jgi:hypothetical protein
MWDARVQNYLFWSVQVIEIVEDEPNTQRAEAHRYRAVSLTVLMGLVAGAFAATSDAHGSR